MNEAREPLTFPGGGREEWPAFDLDCSPDSQQDPDRLTIHPGVDATDLSTRWLSIDYEYAVSLEETR